MSRVVFNAELHPAQWERLVEQPALTDRAVEECLRYDPSIVAVTRVLHEEAEFGVHRLPVNSLVMGVTAAANRDPEVFDDADHFDIGREHNPHLAFGGGPHLCLGANLARLEARAAFHSLARRVPRLHLDSEEVTLASIVVSRPGKPRCPRIDCCHAAA